MRSEIGCSNKSICIVASTLPAAFIDSHANILDVDKIIVLNSNLARSYKSVSKKYPCINIVCAPKGFILQSTFFLLEIITARLRGRTVVVFHECCLTVVDLLLTLIKPKGYYFPQVSMAGWKEIKFQQYPSSKLTRLIKLLGLTSLFRFYSHSPIDGRAPEYVISLRKYPDSIVTKDIGFVRKITDSARETIRVDTKKILFITGKSSVIDEVQKRIYENLILAALNKGYSCFIKDHPNPIYRLNLDVDGTTNYDPLIPSELLDNDHFLVIGVSSTSLLAYGHRSISLVNMIDEMLPEDRFLCINHFDTISPDNKIRYIDSIDEFNNLL